MLGVEEEEEEEEEWRALGLGVCGVDWRPHKKGREVQHAHKHTRRRGKGRKATNPVLERKEVLAVRAREQISTAVNSNCWCYMAPCNEIQTRLQRGEAEAARSHTENEC